MKHYVLLLLSCFVMGTYAQNIKVRGNATAAVDKQPMIGLTVLVKGTTNGTITDFDGNYELNDVPKNGTLVFSMIVFITIEQPKLIRNIRV